MMDTLFVNIVFAFFTVVYSQTVFNLHKNKESKVKVVSNEGEFFVYYKLDDGHLLCGKEKIQEKSEEYFIVPLESIKKTMRNKEDKKLIKGKRR